MRDTISTVVSLANMPSTPTDVALNLIDQSKLLLRASTSSADGLTATSEYVFADGDPTVETTVSVRVAVDLKANAVRNSIRLRTMQIVAVDSVVTESAPVDVTINWTTPGRVEDSAKVLSMIGTAFGLTFHTLVSKVPQTATIDALNRSLILQLFG